MKSPPAPLARKGFTMLETATLVAVVGVLGAVLDPAAAANREIADKAEALNDARQIAQAFATYVSSTPNNRGLITTAMKPGGSRDDGVVTSINDVAFILAKQAGLNNASPWFIPSDAALTGAKLPASVIGDKIPGASDVSPDFKNTAPKSWAFVVGLSTTAPTSTTPLLWTYGLGHDGRWATLSPWKGMGGHIAFADGHVVWATAVATTPIVGETKLLSYITNPDAGQPIVDYAQAINHQGSKPWLVLNADGKGT